MEAVDGPDRPIHHCCPGWSPNTELLPRLAWKHFFSSASLFKYAHDNGIVAEWLQSDNDAFVDLAVSYVRMHESRFSKNVATLLSLYVGRGELWAKRLVWFMQLVDLKGSREMFDLFLRLIDDTVWKPRS